MVLGEPAHGCCVMRAKGRKYNIGVQDQQAYVIKRIDEDFFDES